MFFTNPPVCPEEVKIAGVETRYHKLRRNTPWRPRRSNRYLTLSDAMAIVKYTTIAMLIMSLILAMLIMYYFSVLPFPGLPGFFYLSPMLL